MNKQYSEKYDAYFDADTNQWLEAPCNDPNCQFCALRPDRPITLHDNTWDDWKPIKDIT